MRVDEALKRLPGFSQAVLVVPGQDGYPLNIPTEFAVAGQAVDLVPASIGSAPVRDVSEAHLVFSHIRPYPGVGYDQRRYLDLSGALTTSGGAWRFNPVRARGWDEQDISFPELCQRALPQARRYLSALSVERGHEVKPEMSLGWRFFLATRLPFVSATIVPIFLGLAAAAADGHFSVGLALLTLFGGLCVHLGLNVANDIFDTMSGADGGNYTPTQFSGGSRVLQYGLVTLRQMGALSAIFYGIAIAIGLLLVALTGINLLWLGIAGVLISFFYTAPPLRLVYSGFGELCVALGFGPIMVLGAYFVQTGHYALRPAILSIPVALLVMLILYANEVPDRISDAKAKKRTLVVWLSEAAVIRGYLVAAVVAYAVVVVGVATRLFAWPSLIALATIPMALDVVKGLRAHYGSPYQLMPYLGKNVNLMLYTGLLLVAATLLGIKLHF